MNSQPEFWAVPGPKPLNQRLFVALFPDEHSVQLIHELGGAMRQRHRLTGQVRPLSHLHITLRWINDYAEISQSIVEAVQRACEAAAARAAPFEVRLDRVVSWGNGVGKHPLVLTGHGDHNDPLLEFQHALWKELIKCGYPGKGGRDFNPHITLLYDQHNILEEPVPAVTWIANEIVLVHSEVGHTTYHHRGRWRLRGEA